MSGNEETDTSVKIAKVVLPLLVYLPITLFLLLMGSMFGVRIYKYIVDGGGIANLIEKNIKKIFGIKDAISKFIIKMTDKFWPDENTIIKEENKTWKHVRLDSALVFTGGFFILTMIVIYNYDYVKSLMYSNVSSGIKKATRFVKKDRFKIKKNGALISFGSAGKTRGKIHHVYLKDKVDGEEQKQQLWFSKERIIPDGKVSTKYVKVDDLNKLQAGVQYYFLYDVKVNGQVIKKFNHLQIKNDIIDPGLKGKVYNIKLKWTDEEIDCQESDDVPILLS